MRRRPHLQEFLERCAALFEVVVFTASQKVYAEQLLNVLDPQRRATAAVCLHCLVTHRQAAPRPKHALPAMHARLQSDLCIMPGCWARHDILISAQAPDQAPHLPRLVRVC